jgi:putative transposase
MPRICRLVIPNYPHHVIHRGHNRKPVFVNHDDYRYYLDNLSEWKDNLKCRLYAYCLMTNHVHLIVDPGDDPESLAKLMKRVAGRQTRFVNRIEHRSGTLWEGRYRSSIICKDTYLLACSRYVEMNPVRACMVSHPSEHRWSSYREKTSESSGIIDPDPAFLALSTDESQRKREYEKWIHSSIPEGEWECIREAVQRGHLTGKHQLEEEVAKRLGIRLEMRRPGRPRKSSEKEKIRGK